MSISSASDADRYAAEITQSVPLARTPDFYTYPRNAASAASVEGDVVVIRWEDGRTLRAFALWLWENRIGAAIDDATREGMLDPADLPDGPLIAAASVDDDGNVVVRWIGDASPSTFSAGWLRHVAEGRHRVDALIPAPEPWRATDLGSLPTMPGPPVLDGEPEALHGWLTLLCRHGVARLDGLPVDEDVVARIGAHVGALRDTNFGVTWPVSVDVDPVSTANTALPLPPHSDLPTRETPPGHQFLHCRVNTCEGGLSTMADGYAVAAHLRDHEPVHHDALTTLRWTFFNRSAEHDHRWSGPIIDLGTDGRPTTLRAFHPVRGFPDMPEADMPRAYAALRRFSQLAASDEFQLRTAFRPGDLVAFDNRRILHGRTPIDSNGTRVLHGCYIDHDEVNSRLRVLTRHLDSDPVMPTT